MLQPPNRRHQCTMDRWGSLGEWSSYYCRFECYDSIVWRNWRLSSVGSNEARCICLFCCH
jgi:hypothetical protein